MANFAEREDIKDWLKIPTAETGDNAILDALAPAVTRSFKQYLDRDMFETTYTDEKYNGNGQKRLELRQFPITAVASLAVWEVAVAAAANSVSAGFLFDEFGLYLNPTTLSGDWRGGFGIFPRGFQNVKVTYTAGFASGHEVLATMKTAAQMQGAYLFRTRDRIGLKSETLGQGQTTSYEREPFPPQVKEILDQFKSVALNL